MARGSKESAPAAEESKKKAAAAVGEIGGKKKKKKNKKKNQPGKYSVLLIDTIRKLGERQGSSLAKIYNECKKVGWFDQQHGRTYLRYSIKALLQNDSLVQVKGTGANGSFKLNKSKFEKKPAAAAKPKKTAAVAAPPKPPAGRKVKEAPKKEPPKPAKKTSKPKKVTKNPKSSTTTRSAKKPVKKPGLPRAPRSRSAKGAK